jgi:hypothetical protein
MLGRVEAGAALAETHGFVSPALHLAHEENPNPNHQDKRNYVGENRDPVAGTGLLEVDNYALFLQQFVDIGVVGGNEGPQPVLRFLEIATDFGAGDGDILHLARLNLIHESREGKLLDLAGLVRLHCHHHDDNDANQYHPENGRLDVRVHLPSGPARDPSLDCIPNH